MTLPEHVVCSVLLAQFGMRDRFGWRGVVMMAAAGCAPDLDTASKLFGDQNYWRLHHALGHGALSVSVLAVLFGVAARGLLGWRPFPYIVAWCGVAAAVHVFTDALYWWGIQIFWPFSRREFCFQWIEYLDLLVLALWLMAACCLYRWPSRGAPIAATTLAVFAGYAIARAFAPKPSGWFHFVTGGWMYSAPQGTPVLDWW